MPIETDADVAALLEKLSNWGRWGPDDELGTLNYITFDHRKAAAALVRTGRSVSLARETTLNEGIERGQHEVFRYPGGGCGDYVGLVFHGYTVTHLDALCHIFGRGELYNGYGDDCIEEGGATKCSIDQLGAQGVVGRGVLLDIARSRGKRLSVGDPIHPEDLEKAEEAQGVLVGEGDILFVRNGAGRANVSESAAGLHASCLPWLHERRVSLLGSDGANEVAPSGFEQFRLPIHVVGIWKMGLHLLDNADLDALGEACAEENRWEFLLTIAPLRLKGATGSPVNPIALF